MTTDWKNKGNPFPDSGTNRFQQSGSSELPNQSKYNDTLRNLYTVSFPANHLLIVSFVQRIPNDEQTDYKEKIFSFVTLMPGSGRGGDRGYDSKQKVTQKFSSREIEGLSFILQQVAKGNNDVLPYSKFTNSDQGQKILTVWCQQKQQQFGKQQVPVKEINLMIKSYQGSGYTINMTCDQAYSFGSVLHELFLRGISKELELQNENTSSSISNSSNQSFDQERTELIDQFHSMIK